MSGWSSYCDGSALQPRSLWWPISCAVVPGCPGAAMPGRSPLVIACGGLSRRRRLSATVHAHACIVWGVWAPKYMGSSAALGRRQPRRVLPSLGPLGFCDSVVVPLLLGVATSVVYLEGCPPISLGHGLSPRASGCRVEGACDCINFGPWCVVWVVPGGAPCALRGSPSPQETLRSHPLFFCRVRRTGRFARSTACAAMRAGTRKVRRALHGCGVGLDGGATCRLTLTLALRRRMKRIPVRDWRRSSEGIFVQCRGDATDDLVQGTDAWASARE